MALTWCKDDRFYYEKTTSINFNYLFGKVSSRITNAACTMQIGVATYPASGETKTKLHCQTIICRDT